LSSLPRLTKTEVAFLQAQGLSANDVFDCGDRDIKSCNEEAKKLGKNIVLYGSCSKAGHRLKTRYGHCVQCDTSRITFQGRKSGAGVVYVIYSRAAKLSKIGFSTNISIREDKVRYDVMAGVRDWTLVFFLKTPSAGELEIVVHKALQNLRIEKTYFKDGRDQITKECYNIRPLRAVDRIISDARRNNFEIESHWRLENFDWGQ
jgi:T5orf172 domain